MFALVTYKNLFPRDFSDLQLNKGFVYALFDKSTKYIDSLMCPVGFPLYELLPARDGKICMNQLDEFCQSTDTHLLDHNNIMGFDRLIYDGQETAELEELLREFLA